MAYTDELEIYILNHCQGQTVCYPLVLLEGTIREKWKNTNANGHRRLIRTSSGDTSSDAELSRANKLQILEPECDKRAINHKDMEESSLQIECGSSYMTSSVIGGGFKAVVLLTAGENTVKIKSLNEDVKELNFQLTYAPLTIPRFVRVVYVICADSDGSFDAPVEVPNDVSSAIKRLSFNARLLQTFMAESLHQHGLGHKTFRIEEDDSGSPRVHVFTSSLKTCEALTMTGDELYAVFNEELESSSLYDPLCKFWTFMSCTHYDPPPPEQFDDKLITKYIKAHTALGGGQLALFGTGGLHTWASSIEELVPCFTDGRMIDRHSLFDDSARRGFYWANYATGLGAAMHELGHCFDLAHTPQGIMGRGFDDMNSVFTMWKKPPVEQVAADEETGLEMKDASEEVKGSSEETQTAVQVSTPGGAAVEGLVPSAPVNCGANSLSLESSSIATPGEWSHGAHWYRTSAVLLRYHKWLSTSDPTDDVSFTYNPMVHWCRRVCGPVGNCGGHHQMNQTLFNNNAWLESQNATLGGFIIHTGKYVNSIQTIGHLEKSDTGECKEILSEPQGTDGVGKRYTFTISSPDEYITGVDVRAGGWIDAIRLHTNHKSSIWMGGTGGDEYHLTPPPGRRILGLLGTFGDVVVGSLGVLLNSKHDVAIPEGDDNDDDSLLIHAPLGIRLIELWDKKHSEVYQHWEFLDSHPPQTFTLSRAEVKDKASTLLVEDDKGNIFRTALVYDYSGII